MSTIGCPMHRIDFGQVAPEGAPWAHDDARERVDFCRHSAH